MAMDKAKWKRERRKKAHSRVRKSVKGTAERPRMSVFKSSKYIYVQVVDDATGRTLVQANSGEAAVSKALEGSSKTKNAAEAVGRMAATRAKEQGIEQVVFDRGGYVYHGRVEQVAKGARAEGLQF